MNNKGFTLIELMLSSAFIGFLLLIILTAFVQVNVTYNRGITVKRVQESTRQITEELTRFISSAKRGSSSTNVQIRSDRICIEGVRYIWNEGFRADPPDTSVTKVLSDGRGFTFIRMIDNRPCDDSTNYTGSAQYATELVDDRLAIQLIDITSPVLGVYTLNVTVSTNTPDLVNLTNPSEIKCNVVVGDQFCDVAQLRTTVTLRN